MREEFRYPHPRHTRSNISIGRDETLIDCNDAALNDVIVILDRVGGWLRQARAVRDGVKTSNGGAQS